MKIIIYYLLLLIAIALIIGYTLSGNGSAMSMTQVLGISAYLAIYTVALSLVGEGKTTDERDQVHRYLSNRIALISTTVVISLGIIIQLFVTHHLDFWLLGSLIVLNLTKIISLIYFNYKN
jgi:uncharacterized membrane protein